jgi:hypothetical protein
MVQIFDSGPSFSSRLASAFFNPITESIQQQAQAQLQERLLRQKQAGDLAKEQQKISLKQSYLDKILGPQEQQEGPLSQRFDQEMQPGQQMPEGQQMPKGQLQKRFDPSQISDEQIARISATDPSIARELRAAKDTAFSQQQAGRKEEVGFHKESAKYDEELMDKTKIAKNQINSIKDIKKAVSSGNVRPTSIANIFRGMGETGSKIANAFINKDEATLLANIPNLLEGWKQVFGVRLSDADLKVLQDKLPDIGKDPKSNKAILDIMEKYADITLLRGKIAADVKKENKGLRPLGYADIIEERFDEMTKPVEVINPTTGRKVQIPTYKLSQALEAGAKLPNE